MLPVYLTKTLAAASSNNIATSQTPSGAGNLTLNGSTVSGGVATLDSARRVIITSAANDSGRTWTVYGTNSDSQKIVDQFAGANVAAAASSLDFLTVTRIAVDAATAGAVTAGTNAVGSTPWQMLNIHLAPCQIFFQTFVASGSPTWSIEFTMDDFFTPAPPVGVAVTPVPNAWAGPITAVTSAASGRIIDAVRGWRLSLSAVGGVTVQAIQSGISNA